MATREELEKLIATLGEQVKMMPLDEMGGSPIEQIKGLEAQLKEITAGEQVRQPDTENSKTP